MAVIGGVDAGGGGGCETGRFSGGSGRRSGLKDGCFGSWSGRRSGLARCWWTSISDVSGSRYIASEAVELGGGDLWRRELLPTSLGTLAGTAPTATGFVDVAVVARPSSSPPPSDTRRHRRTQE